MTPAFTLGSLSCVVLACGGGCFQSQSTPAPAPVCAPAETPAEAPAEAQAETPAADADAQPEIARAPEAQR